MKEWQEPKEYMYKTVEDRPRFGFTRITTYFREDGQIKGFQKLIRTKVFGRWM
jgi:hypothetical protein